MGGEVDGDGDGDGTGTGTGTGTAEKSSWEGYFDEGNKRYILDTPVKMLSSGPQNYPQVTFNKRYEGYRTVPSAVPYQRRALYDRVTVKKIMFFLEKIIYPPSQKPLIIFS